MPSPNLKEYNKQYYEEKKESRRLQVLERQKTIKEEVRKYKLERGCSVCGYNKSGRALQFHHTNDDKDHTIARMVNQGRALTSIMEEIEKCIVVCANCHCEIHEQEEN